MNARPTRRRGAVAASVIGSIVAYGGWSTVRVQGPQVQAVDASGAPMFRVDPFWPQPLPNRWSMQQVTGIHVDHLDHGR